MMPVSCFQPVRLLLQEIIKFHETSNGFEADFNFNTEYALDGSEDEMYEGHTSSEVCSWFFLGGGVVA
jgi:hypothetical protein